ncbi:MAG: PDC sensor domain-containing protein, partial [Synergistaceae bacterium]|nr:PDC sensor domain-containing protein [Synergistaceae bacterium]
MNKSPDAGKNQKRVSIFTKARRRMVIAMLISGVAIFVVASVTILLIRHYVAQTSARLGESATADSAEGLSELAAESLFTIASDRARVCDEKLGDVSRTVRIIAQELTYIFANPGKYRASDILPPDPANDGEAIPQLLLAEGVAVGDVALEVGLIGNLQGQMTAIMENNANLESVQLGSRTGICVMTDRYSSVKPEHVDGRDRPWYLAAAARDGLIWTDVFNDSFGRGLAITCAASYYDADGGMLGVVGSSMLLKTLESIVEESFGVGLPSRAFIVDENTSVLIAMGEDDEPENIMRDKILEHPSETMRAAGQKIMAGEMGIDRVAL